MAREDYAGAAKELELIKAKTGPALYARFNLGVALVKGGEAERGMALLDEVGKTPAVTEEYRSLRDKANLALGFSSLQTNNPDRARVYLERVRLNGMLANKALLGFGWAAAALKQPKVALVPWTELSGRDTADSAVLEAKLAVPYAFAELGAYGQALDGYKSSNGTKTHVVLLDFVDGQYEIQAGQHDGSTGMTSPVRRARTVDRQFVARTVALLIDRDFGLVGTLDPDTRGGRVKVTIKGSGLGVPIDRWLKKDDVFAVARKIIRSAPDLPAPRQ